MNTWKYRFLLPLSLLLMLPAEVLSVDSGRMMWVLGSFREEAGAESQAQVLTQMTGQEVLIQTLLVNGSIRHRLLIQPDQDENDQEGLLMLLESGGFNDHWRTWLQGDEIGIQSLIAAPARTEGDADNRFEEPFFMDYQDDAEMQEDMVPYSLPERRSEQVVPLSASDSAEDIKYNPASLVRQQDH
jgi:hypothetical protein